MSEDKLPTLDLKGEYIEHVHLLSSEEAGWEILDLIYEREPAGEMPQVALERHALAIILGDFRASFEVEGRWQVVNYRAGDICLFPANDFFPKAQLDRDVPLLELFIAPSAIAQVADNCHGLELTPRFQFRDPLIYQMGLALMAELASAGADSRFYGQSIAIALSAHLVRHYASADREIRSYSGGLSALQLKTAIALIRDRKGNNPSLADLAASVHLSPHYFATLFKQSTGLTPHQYSLQCRIDRAKDLLHRLDLPIVEIARQVGFQNQSHFTRVFRRYTKLTPKAYRDCL